MMLIPTVISLKKVGLKPINCTLYVWFSLASLSTAFLLPCLAEQLFPTGTAVTDGAVGKEKWQAERLMETLTSSTLLASCNAGW